VWDKGQEHRFDQLNTALLIFQKGGVIQNKATSRHKKILSVHTTTLITHEHCPPTEILNK
jgi:hypothetical protein